MPNIGATELLILVVVLILLFGAKKLPDAARSLGRSMRIFKSEVKEMSNDDQPSAAQPSQQPQQGQIAAPQQDFWDQPQNQPQAQPGQPSQQPQPGQPGQQHANQPNQ